MQSAYWCIPRLTLPSPIETVARDLEAQTLAFSAPSCRLLLLQGALKQLIDCTIRFRYTKGCSNKHPIRIFWIKPLQTLRTQARHVGKMKYSNLRSTKVVARAKYVSCRSIFSGDLAQENGQLSGSVLPCFSWSDRLPIFSRDGWSNEKVLVPAFTGKITRTLSRKAYRHYHTKYMLNDFFHTLRHLSKQKMFKKIKINGNSLWL